MLQPPDASRRQEFWDGVRAEAPLLLGVAPFGVAYGAYAIERGLTHAMAQSMSAIVFGGASQFVAVQILATGGPLAVMVLAGLLVNLRHMLYSASLAPRIAHLSLRWRWLLGYLLTDEAYVVGITRFERGDAAPHRHWFLFGAAAALWATWQATTAMGVLLGGAVPESWSLDFALPLTFIAMLVPTLTNRATVVAAVVAGSVALLGNGWRYETGLMAALLAGMAAAMLVSRLLGEDAAPESGDDEARART